MKHILIILALIMTSSNFAQKHIIHKTNKNYPFYVGTYTNGDSQGIYKYELLKNGSLRKIGLAARSINPSFLTLSKDKKFLIAVNEIDTKNGNGTVESFLIKKDQLLPISKSSSGGANPCFVATNKSDFVLTANYSSGTIGLLKLDKKGELSGLLDVQQHTGKGITDRQKSPHAHSAWFDADNKIISIDLGTNELWFSKLDYQQEELAPSNPDKLAMEPGAGPRHLAFHPNKKWIYVINELNSTVTLLQKNNNGKYKKGASFSTLPKAYTKPNTCADIHISNDGKFVYASNRGHNSIAVFKVNTNDGTLHIVGYESTKGGGPRNFALSPDNNFLVVANQLTNNIVSFKRNSNTGLLQYIQQIKAPTPVCILFD